MVGIKHAKVVTQANNAAYDVSTTNWNVEHTIDDASIPFKKLEDDVLSADYVIYKSGSTYYALPSRIGGTKYSDDDGISVLQAANDALSTTGGTILLKCRISNASAPFVMGSATVELPFTLIGSGVWTGITLANGVNDSIIKTRGGVLGFAANGFQTIANMTLDGNAAGQAAGHGINFCAYYSLIDNVMVTNCKESGINVTGVDAAHTAVDNALRNVHSYSNATGFSMINYGSDVSISSSRLFYNSQDGIYQQAGNLMLTNSSIYGNTRYGIYQLGSIWSEITGNWFGDNTSVDIYIASSGGFQSGNTNIIGNSFYCTTKAGGWGPPIIFLDGSGAFPINNVNIVGNDFWSTTVLCGSALWFDPDVTSANVANNSISGTFGTGPIHLDAGSVLKISGNTGYNPVGNIANPYPVAAGYLNDTAGAQAFPTTATNYTVNHSPKLVTIYGGTITSVSIDGVATGQSGAGTFAAYHLNPGQVLNVVWTVQPSSVVYAC